MSQRLFAAIPAERGHYVSTRELFSSDDWGPWVKVLAWGFSEYDSRPIPVTIMGQPGDTEDWRIKTPEGQVHEV